MWSTINLENYGPNYLARWADAVRAVAIFLGFLAESYSLKIY